MTITVSHDKISPYFAEKKVLPYFEERMRNGKCYTITRSVVATSVGKTDKHYAFYAADANKNIQRIYPYNAPGSHSYKDTEVPTTDDIISAIEKLSTLENCRGCTNCTNCKNCVSCAFCTNCENCRMCMRCIDCTNSTGLVNKANA